MAVEFAVNRSGVDVYIWMGFVQGGNAFRASQQANKLDGLGVEFLIGKRSLELLFADIVNSTSLISKLTIRVNLEGFFHIS